MTAHGGWLGKITIDENAGGAGAEITGADNYSLSWSRGEINVQTYALARAGIADALAAGLKSGTLKISGKYDSGDAGMVELRTEALATTTSHKEFECFYEGVAAGIMFRGVVMDFKVEPPVDGANTWTSTIKLSYDGTSAAIATF